jgi:hypothetical protein
VTDATGQQQINDFVVGVKNLGLYNNMVAWPLRSTQNAGTGVTAYSIGGLGTYDGTLTNGPTWGTGGVTFDGTNDYIQTAFTGSLSEFTIFSAATPSTSTIRRSELMKSDAVPGREFIFRAYDSGNTSAFIFNPGTVSITGPAYQTTIRSYFFRASSSVNKLRRNNETDGTGITGVLTTGSNPVTIGARSDGAADYFIGTIHAPILFNKALTDSETSSMYTLYSTTLGSGLGLP